MEQLKKFKCHKEVHAIPMTFGEYCLQKALVIPHDKDPDEEGYLVVYSKDTPDHYESWSPKKQFEEGYSLIERDVKVVSASEAVKASSDLSCDDAMEREIRQKGLVYPRIEKSHIDAMLNDVVFHHQVLPGTTTTVISAVLPMEHISFTLCTEIMACVDPRNFNAELGVKYGIEKAKKSAADKLWELEGYALAKSLISKPDNKG